jgi:hexosaminidase
MKQHIIIFNLLLLFFVPNAFAQLNLMPIPEHYKLEEGKFRVDTSFNISIKGNPDSRIYPAATRMLRRLSGRTGIFFKQDYITKQNDTNSEDFEVECKEPGKLELNEDESYSLFISSKKILLVSNNDLGVLHGFETLLQLLSSDNQGYYFPAIEIKDKPRFPWRGLLIDVARHFEPIAVLKRNIDGMAALKMNVLHLHLTDDQGFRIESKVFPKLTELGSDGKFYTQAQIKNLLKYASDRGIRIVPEFDIPGHSTSWLVGYPQYASAPGPYKVERKFGVFNPTFDPTNEKTYIFLDKFFAEMAKLFPDEYVHIGGDENNGKQWSSNPKIQEFMKRHNIADNHALQTYFNKRILKILTKYHKKMIGWDEILQPGMPKNIIIQSWRGVASMVKAAKEGYKSILSSGYYLDLMESAKYYYLNDPLPDSSALTESQAKNILGGEAAMWGELVTPETIDSRIWPRTAAIAERLWSPKDIKDVDDMYRRLKNVSFHLEELGLTHIKNYDMMLRRLTNNQEIEPLKELINIVEPLKGYERFTTGITYTSFAPYTRVVDAARPESMEAREFNILVDKYTKGDTNNINLIKYNLTVWNGDRKELKDIIHNSPILWEIDSLSIELQTASAIGLKAITFLKNSEKTDTAWVNAEIKILEKCKKTYGQVKLAVINPIEELVKLCAIKRN